MRRAFALSFLVVTCLLLGSLPAAGAAAVKVEVGKVRMATTATGSPALLVPVTYPIEMAGRRVRVAVQLRRPDGVLVRAYLRQPTANAGPLRAPERRKRFVFVHRIGIGSGIAGELSAGNRLEVDALAALDVDRDGKRELSSLDSASQTVPLATAGSPLCSTPPKRRTKPGQRVVVPLPLCTQGVRWTIAGKPKHGSARIRGGKLIFRPAKGFRGTASVALAAHGTGGARASILPVMSLAPVQITVATAKSPVVRAFGDSVTAGFGYFEKGEPMPLEDLLSCRPGATSYDDACSSNSKVRSNKAKKVEYSADYGLSNNVSWAAQWANAHGVTNFKNFAVSGSEPSDWFGKGQFAATSKELAAEDPDYVLFTMGANPLLSNMLFGIGNIGCGIWADFMGRFRECIKEEFEEIKLRQNLTTLYENLAKETQARIVVMMYHLSIPTTALYSVEQITVMGDMLNEEIDSTVAATKTPGRFTVVEPPHFNVGLALGEGWHPPTFRCEGYFSTSIVDGPSVQATISQRELRALHPTEFCPQDFGPNPDEEPWVISGDSGIHPSATGYEQMASKVPAPK